MAVTGYGSPVVDYSSMIAGPMLPGPAPNQSGVTKKGNPYSTTQDIQGSLIHNMTSDLFSVPGEPAPMPIPTIGPWTAGSPVNVQQYRNTYAASQPPPQPQQQSQGLTFPTLKPPAPLPQPGLLVNGQPNPGAHVTNFQTGPSAPATFDPAAPFNNQTPAPPLPGLNTSGTNPYLNDPLMAGYNGMQNPLYANQGQQDFYGDPELFSAPSAASATKG